MEPLAFQRHARSFEEQQALQCVPENDGMFGRVEPALRLGAVWRLVSVKLVFKLLAVRQSLKQLLEAEPGLLVGHVRQAIPIPEFTEALAPRMWAEHAHRLAGWNEERLVVRALKQLRFLFKPVFVQLLSSLAEVNYGTVAYLFSCGLCRDGGARRVLIDGLCNTVSAEMFRCVLNQLQLGFERGDVLHKVWHCGGVHADWRLELVEKLI